MAALGRLDRWMVQMINPQVLLVVGFLLIAGGLFASIGWLAAPVCVGVLALIYSMAIEP